MSGTKTYQLHVTMKWSGREVSLAQLNLGQVVVSEDTIETVQSVLQGICKGIQGQWLEHLAIREDRRLDPKHKHCLGSLYDAAKNVDHDSVISLGSWLDRNMRQMTFDKLSSVTITVNQGYIPLPV